MAAANALLRSKLKTEHGMTEGYTQGIPPELENMWLTNILKFEEAWKNSQPVSVFEHLDRPSLPRLDQLPAADVSRHLRRLDKLMLDKGVVLDRRRHHKAATIYRFITEELFNKELHVRPDGNFVWHFIYEEFYPDEGKSES